jgi:hypothetical protein
MGNTGQPDFAPLAVLQHRPPGRKDACGAGIGADLHIIVIRDRQQREHFQPLSTFASKSFKPQFMLNGNNVMRVHIHTWWATEILYCHGWVQYSIPG